MIDLEEAGVTQGGASGVYGRSGLEWAAYLGDLEAKGEVDSLAKAIAALRKEVADEQASLVHFESLSFFDRHFHRDPHELEPRQARALAHEVEEETRLASRTAETLRRQAVPRALWPFLSMTPAFLRRDLEGVQYPGFEKYVGTDGRRETQGVTLFAHRGAPAEEIPPSFFLAFDRSAQVLLIDRVHRTALPAGAGLAVVEELARRLGVGAGLKTVRLKNVVNEATRTAFVDESGPTPRLRSDAELSATPLGKLVTRLVTRLGLGVGAVHPELRSDGQLHISIDIRRR